MTRVLLHTVTICGAGMDENMYWSKRASAGIHMTQLEHVLF
jgi:hypothetical protein